MATNPMTATSYKRKVTPGYFDLVRAFPLRRIRDDREHRQALRVVERLLSRGDADLDEGELEYLEALSWFVEAYENSHHGIDLSGLTPRDILKHLMEESRMTPADLGRLLGSQPVASLILHGKRQLSKTHIRKLAEHFHVQPGLFLCR